MRKSLAVVAIVLGLAVGTLWAFSTQWKLRNATSRVTQPSASTSSPSSKGSAWGESYFPNVTLVTQEGKRVRFYDDLIKGKKVLVNFIFAYCEERCPLATAKLAQVQKLLGPRVGRDIFMYSITLDPEHDTPKVLKAYAKRYRAKPGWLFLTGKRKDIDAVRFKFGERTEKEEHPDVVRAGNGATSQWMKLPLEGDLNLLVTEIGKTFDPNWYADKSAKSYDEAPRLQVPEPGEIVFRNRCAACHTVGKGDFLGPDLAGVTAHRDRAWLVRYIAAPDEVRASKDPISLKLFAKYNKVLMPRLNLTSTEIEDLIIFLETQTSGSHPKEEESHKSHGDRNHKP